MPKILLICHDQLGCSMAGPAIRYYEFAKALAPRHHVILMGHGAEELKNVPFEKVPYSYSGLKKALAIVDVVVTQQINPLIAYLGKRFGVKFILDAYDPMPLENLEQFKDSELLKRHDLFKKSSDSLRFSFSMADSVICANHTQKDLWMGFLLSMGKINPTLYDQDKHLRNLIEIVPFGISSTPPQKQGEGLRAQFNLAQDDQVILWGGGIWNWFDPLSLIQAVELISQRNPKIKLVFMGIKHPNPLIPEMRMSADALELAKNLNLLNKHVFFNFDWVPYQKRQNYLLEADIGVSTHLEHLETRYAFRTRILDYLWAELPIVATVGDSFADLIKSKNLGAVVPYQDPRAIASSISGLLADPQRMKGIKENIKAIKCNFTWEKLIRPIEEMSYQLSGKKTPHYVPILPVAAGFIKTRGVKPLITKLIPGAFS